MKTWIKNLLRIMFPPLNPPQSCGDFTVGDKVYCTFKEKHGVVEKIDLEGTNYPIKVRGEDRIRRSYTKEGKYWDTPENPIMKVIEKEGNK